MLVFFLYIKKIHTYKILMDSKVKFFSKNVAISKKDFNENCDKLNYQRKLIRDIEKKHKDWANEIDQT